MGQAGVWDHRSGKTVPHPWAGTTQAWHRPPQRAMRHEPCSVRRAARGMRDQACGMRQASGAGGSVVHVVSRSGACMQLRGAAAASRSPAGWRRRPSALPGCSAPAPRPARRLHGHEGGMLISMADEARPVIHMLPSSQDSRPLPTTYCVRPAAAWQPPPPPLPLACTQRLLGGQHSPQQPPPCAVSSSSLAPPPALPVSSGSLAASTAPGRYASRRLPSMDASSAASCRMASTSQSYGLPYSRQCMGEVQVAQRQGQKQEGTVGE